MIIFAQFFLEGKMFQTKFVEKIKTHFILNNTFRLCDNVEKHSPGGQATDDNMAHAHCMLDN